MLDRANVSSRLRLIDIMAMAPDIVAVARLRRPAIENAITALIDALDALEPDCDLEDDGCAEPYCGFAENVSQTHNLRNPTMWDECEPEADAEPSLGSPETVLTISDFRYGPPAMFDQTRWGSSGMHDLELVNEDGGDVLDEPEAVYA